MNYKVVAPLLCLALAGCSGPAEPSESGKAVLDAEDDAIQEASTEDFAKAANEERLKKIVEFVRVDPVAGPIGNDTIDCTTFPPGDDQAKCHQIEDALKLTDEKAAYPSSRLHLMEALGSSDRFGSNPNGIVDGIQTKLNAKLKLSVLELAKWLECDKAKIVFRCIVSFRQLHTAASNYMKNGIIEGLEESIIWHLAHLVGVRKDKLEELAEVLRPLGQSTEVFKPLGQTPTDINNICQNVFSDPADQKDVKNLWVNVIGAGLEGKPLPEALVTAIYIVQAETMTFIVMVSAGHPNTRPVVDIAKELLGGVYVDNISEKPIPLGWPKIWPYPRYCEYQDDFFLPGFEILAKNGILYKEIYDLYLPFLNKGGVQNLQLCKDYVRALQKKSKTLNHDGQEGLQQIQTYIDQVVEWAPPSGSEGSEIISWFIFGFVAIFAVVNASRQRESLVHRGTDGFDLGCLLQTQSLPVEI